MRKCVARRVEEQKQPPPQKKKKVFLLIGSDAVPTHFLPTILAGSQPYLAYKSLLCSKNKGAPWSKTSRHVFGVSASYRSELSRVLVLLQNPWCCLLAGEEEVAIPGNPCHLGGGRLVNPTAGSASAR